MQNRKKPNLKNKKSYNIQSSDVSVNITDDKILDMLLASISMEMSSISYYQKLIEQADSDETREMLSGIKADEIKHEKMLKDIYFAARNKEAVVSLVESYVSGDRHKAYSDAIAHQLDTVEFSKRLYLIVKNQNVRDMMFDIITDEQMHVMKLTALMLKN